MVVTFRDAEDKRSARAKDFRVSYMTEYSAAESQAGSRTGNLLAIIAWSFGLANIPHPHMLLVSKLTLLELGQVSPHYTTGTIFSSRAASFIVY